MILQLSWKNIWRTRRRSFVVIGAIAVGVWALIFLFSFLNSFNEGYLKNAIQYEYSHMQVHTNAYLDDAEISNFIDPAQYDRLNLWLTNHPVVEHYSERFLVNGMISSANSSQGIVLYGIDTSLEQATTNLRNLISDGDYFQGNRRNQILISEELAEKLHVKLRSKIVVTYQDFEGNISSAAFRVAGIFESKSPTINKTVAYVQQKDLERLLGKQVFHEYAILLSSIEDIEAVVAAMRNEFPDLVIEPFKALAPELDLLEQQSKVSKQVLTTIIMLALLFGIINTMLMAVLERTREIGMLRAVGMHKKKIFSMILLETILLSLVGGPIGILLGVLTNKYFGIYGLDLSAYAESLKDYGYDSIFYPSIEPDLYITLMVVVIFTALLGAVYPALKAIQLKPVEAIRKL